MAFGERAVRNPGPCITGCGRPAICRGRCRRCYANARYHGQLPVTPRPKLPPFYPDREQLAWVAGFIDGEGSFMLQGGRLPILAIPQSGDDAPAILGRAREVLGLGGTIGTHRPGRGKLAYRLTIAGFERTQAALARVWPWLTEPKRRQGRRVLTEFHDHYMLPGQRRRMNNEVQRRAAGAHSLFDEEQDATTA